MTSPSPQRGRLSFVGAAAALVAAMAGIGWGIGQYRKNREPSLPSGPGPTASNRGAFLYQTACANCHGPEGAGDGSSPVALKPPPRDFATRPWRFEATRASIRQVILKGIPGTAMPASQGSLTETDVDALVEHVYTLATTRPPVTYELSPEEKLCKAAGVVDLHGSDPPPLTLSNVSGQSTTLVDLRGKLVIVNFWGTACVHCLKEMPHLRKLEADHAGRGLTVLHVCADADDAAQAQALLDKYVPGTKAWIDETGLSLARFEVQALPTVWLIGPDGKAVGRTSGAMDWHSPCMTQLIDHWLPRRK